MRVFPLNTQNIKDICFCTHTQKICFSKFLLLWKKITSWKASAFTLCMHACSCESACPLSQEHTLMHSLHVWMTTSAIHNNPRSDVQCAEYVLMFVCAWLVRVRGGYSRNRNVSWKHQNGESFHCKGYFHNRPEGAEACLFHLSSLFALIHFCNSNVFNPMSALTIPPFVSKPFLLSGHVCYERVECCCFFFGLGSVVNTRDMMMTELQYVRQQSLSLWMPVRRWEHSHE